MPKIRSMRASVEVDFFADGRFRKLSDRDKLFYLATWLYAVKVRREFLRFPRDFDSFRFHFEKLGPKRIVNKLEMIFHLGLIDLVRIDGEKFVRVNGVKDLHSHFKVWNDPPKWGNFPPKKGELWGNLGASLSLSLSSNNVTSVFQPSPNQRGDEKLCIPEDEEPIPDVEAFHQEPDPEPNEKDRSWILEWFKRVRGVDPTPFQATRLLQYLGKYGKDPKVWKKAFEAWGDSGVANINYLRTVLQTETERKAGTGADRIPASMRPAPFDRSVTTYHPPHEDVKPAEPEAVRAIVGGILANIRKRSGTNGDQ